MGLFGAIGSAIGGSKGKGSLSDFMKQFTSQNNSSGNKPVDDSHTHSNSSQRRDDAMQKRSGGRPETQQPVPIVQPNNMANNNYTNPNTQRVGADLFKGEALASQTAQRRMMGSNPTPLPGEESGGMGDNQLQAPLMQQKLSKKQTVKNDPKLEKGTDASYGISGYVNTEKEYKQALQEKNHPNIYKSPVMQTDFPHAKPGTKYNYKKGDLMDETDHEESEYKSTNEGKIKGTRYNTENVSDIQEDNKGQFMTTLGDDESYDPDSPRPTSSRVTSYDQGRNAVRDTLRPAKGKQFVSSWKLNK